MSQQADSPWDDLRRSVRQLRWLVAASLGLEICIFLMAVFFLP